MRCSGTSCHEAEFFTNAGPRLDELQRKNCTTTAEEGSSKHPACAAYYHQRMVQGPATTSVDGRASGDCADRGVHEHIHGSRSWSFFTLKDERTVDTMTIFCLITQPKGDSAWGIEGVKVSRGTATPVEN